MDGSQTGEDEERRAIAALMDPAALERRLAEARRRREAALAARRKVAPETPAPAPPPTPTPVLAAAPMRPSAPPRARPRRVGPIAAIFVAGSLAGAVVAGLGPRMLDVLTGPPQPPPEIAAEVVRSASPETSAPPPLLTPDPGATPPTRALAPEALPERPLSTPLDGARIIVNAPAGTDGAATAAAMDALQAAKPGSLTRADARVTIRESNVRYFHLADQAAAVEVAARLSPVLGSTPAIRDFTDFTPRPSEGAIEVWLEGDAPAFTARRAAPQPGPADIVMDTVRRARITLERAVDALPGIPLR